MKVLAVAAMLLMASTAAQADEESQHEAREHYERGMAHYELGEFSDAIAEFKLAYERAPMPGLLFNLAQASRLGKDYEQALHFYRAYLRARPDASNRDDVEKRIVELEPVVAARRRAEEQRLSTVSRPPPARAEAAPALVAPRPGGKQERIAGIAVGAVGVALLGGGIGFGVAALDAENRLSRLASSMGSWTPAQAQLYHDGQRDAAAATALYVVGGAAIATGVVLYVVGWRKDRPRFAVAPTNGGAQAVWSCAF